jgi:hypothetical protein
MIWLGVASDLSGWGVQRRFYFFFLAEAYRFKELVLKHSAPSIKERNKDGRVWPVAHYFYVVTPYHLLSTNM